MKDGFHYYCKDCSRRERNRYYKDNKNITKKVQKKYHLKVRQEFLNGMRKTVKEKICPKCKRRKKAKYFAKSLTNPTGLYVYCNSCRKKYWREKRKSKERKYKKRKYLLSQSIKGKTMQDIATENNCAYGTIQSYAKKFNIKFKNGNTKNPKDCSPNYHRKGYHKNGRKRNKKAQIAERILENAVKNKQILKSNYRQVCSKIGGKISGHHYDYNKPLEVIWTCPSCHRKIHIKNLDKIESIETIKEKLSNYQC